MHNRPVTDLSELVGTSAAMEEVRALVRQAALSMEPLLLIGEAGTGKALAARCVHSLSERSAAPFVEINCYVLQDPLFESEFFGVEKETFSGPRKQGLVEQAEGGALFFDGVSELSPASQVKLLRFILEKEYERVGGTDTYKANVRVMATTYRSLPEMVSAGTFREDLFGRMSAVQIFLPPLRDRPGDLEVLVRHFMNQFGPRYGHQSASVTPGALARLSAMTWFDNVRDLENFIERCVVRAPPGDIVLDEASVATERAPSAPPVRPTRDARMAAEREAVEAAMKKAGGIRTVAARILGVSRRTLYNKLVELRLASAEETKK